MIGSAPITQAVLDGGTLPPDVDSIVTLLDGADRAVQTQGWGFNEEDYTLTPESDGTVNAPSDQTVLAVSAHEKEYKTLPRLRGTILFDQRNRTRTFEQDVRVIAIIQLPWDELPEVARVYIMIRAGRTFVSDRDNSEILWQYSSSEERKALSDLMGEELTSSKVNMMDRYDHARIKAVTR